MRLWSLHPKYLDPQGLVALWREALLAKAVLRGETRGYRSHPQLERFKNQTIPLAAISLYLQSIYAESVVRGYAFDKSKIQVAAEPATLVVTSGQLDYEWRHLMNKLKAYKLQEEGRDTVQANEELGFQSDERDYGVGAQILRDLGISKIRLMSNNPKKRAGLIGYGLEIVDNVAIEIESNEHNKLYLETKRDKMGHSIKVDK